ncbi:MAG TPA: hypothetical protein DCQ94_22100 [Nitrospira sp.]|jgi:hypothetical protein|nr:hypothetical protein [Nitrospira sp.]
MNGTEEEEGGIIAQAPHDVNHEKCVKIMKQAGCAHAGLVSRIVSARMVVEAWAGYRERFVQYGRHVFFERVQGKRCS